MAPNFFACPSLGLVLSAAALARRAPAASHRLWGVGTFTMLAFSAAVVSTWINHDTFRIHHVGPAWFIPVAGYLVVPAAGAGRGLYGVDPAAGRAHGPRRDDASGGARRGRHVTIVHRWRPAPR